MAYTYRDSDLDEIALNVYYKLPDGKLVHYLAQSETTDLDEAVKYCQDKVAATLPDIKHVAILAVIKGGKA